MKVSKTPTTTEAEEWVTPDIFKARGKYWQVNPDSSIVETTVEE